MNALLAKPAAIDRIGRLPDRAPAVSFRGRLARAAVARLIRSRSTVRPTSPVTMLGLIIVALLLVSADIVARIPSGGR